MQSNSSPPASLPGLDGVGRNLTQDGRWDYVWDGENRLKSLTTTTAAVTAGIPKQRLSFAYDGNSRRIRKVVEHWDAVGSDWEVQSQCH